jgi:arginase
MTTLRLVYPQWQGGNRADYHAASFALAGLLPESDGPTETVPVRAPVPGETLAVDRGICARDDVLAQARAARGLIERHQPDAILCLGGDCAVSLAPFAYLSQRYGNDLGVLWVDAHPDISTPADNPNAHTHVLAALLGTGDRDVVAEVAWPIQPSHVMYAGLDAWSEREGEWIKSNGLSTSGSGEIAEDSSAVLRLIADRKIKALAVHFDVDVLLPSSFGPLLFNWPDALADYLKGVPRGKLLPGHVIRLLADAGRACNIVGLTIAEFMPWRSEEARGVVRQLPLVG